MNWIMKQLLHLLIKLSRFMGKQRYDLEAKT